MKTLLAYIRLTRPANLVTAVADIAAGVAVAIIACGYETCSPLPIIIMMRLSMATIGLYAGGVVMNDVADYELDKIERPERPIPSGFASKEGATVLGITLLLAGIFFAAQVSWLSGIIAASIAVLALLYDYLGKHHNFFGPVNMGLCRGGNLLLGMSACRDAVDSYFWLAIIPVIYISAITMISRGEVVGGNKTAIRYASLMYAIVAGIIAYLSIITKNYFYPALIFLALFTFLIYRPLIVAYNKPEAINIRSAVKTGIISLIVMDAAIATCFTGWVYGLCLLALLPVSVLLARIFAVT
ncbi:MAG: UbiA-like protein EboC [Bacteroidia bacterium]